MHPLKWLQNKLAIAAKWQALKSNLRPHKFTLMLVIGVGTYPWQQKVDIAIQNYSKYLVQQVLNDKKILEEMSNFSERVSKEETTQEATKELLLKAVKSKEFEDQAEILSKNITENLLQDGDVQEKSEQLVDRILASKKVQNALEESLIKVIDTERMKETLQNLFEKTFSDQPFQAAISELLERSFGDLLNNPETGVKLKQFVSYLMDTNYGKKNRKQSQNSEVKSENKTLIV